MTVALVRGAATVLNKDWGVLINCKYTDPLKMETGEELYDDMIYAYNSGAKYILVYDANEGWTDGILGDDHFQAMRDFWQYVEDNPRQNTWQEQRTAFVLPADYGCAFRGPNDEVWGKWAQDETSVTINAAMREQLRVYGDNLDVIYDDGLEAGNYYGYSQLIYWDDPSAQPTPTPTPPHTPSPTPIPSPTPTASPTPSPSPSPTPSPTPSPSPSPTQQPTPSPEVIDGFFVPTVYVYAIVAAVSIAVVVIIAIWFIRKRR
jgi:hypothetical protein